MPDQNTRTRAVSPAVLPEGRASIGGVLPTSLQQIGTMIRFELLNYFRSRRFFILLAIAVIIAGLLTAVIGYYRPESFVSADLGFYSGWWGTASGFVIVLSAIFFGGDAISGEFQNKTGYFLVGNPVRRSSIYIGKWFAALIASLIILGVFAAITIANGIYYFGPVVPYQFVMSLAFSVFYLIAALGFTFFFSSVFKSSSMSILVTVILLLFGFNIIDTIVSNVAHIEPWFTLTYGSSIISNVLMSTYPPHTQSVQEPGRFSQGGTGPTITVYSATIPEGLAIMGLYFIVTAVVGLILFERKEFN